MRKVNRIVLCVLMVNLLLSGCSSESREEVMKEVKSTDLSNENIQGIELGMSINDESFIENYGPFSALPDNKQYTSTRNYDQYWNEHIIMSVDRANSEILQIGTLDKNDNFSTVKGIKNGSTIEDVISTYGENYYKYEDKEQSINVIGYVDRQDNIDLAFTYINDEVISVSLSYAFERLKWKK
ncbi:hypothetical protein [Gottfriedia solisilvae]|uniref:hypothetical protein n=1 Tax=Gottfriedia solisilvae TaxID=1516104 RepID=UPI00114FECD0|nr:hypothetical protein [Gottfriedia solisilvae]